MANSLDSEIVFVANHEPPLKAKAKPYTLDLNYQLEYGEKTQTKNFIKQRAFAVGGERFSLKDNVIDKLFPPAKSQGEFDNVLPHVVFSRRTLPWERTPVDSATNSSWLAILVFREDSAPTPISDKLTGLYPASAPDGGGQLPAGVYSSGADLPAGQRFLGYGESPDDLCVYIDVSSDQFASVAPSLADLAWNAHGRTLKTSGKEPPGDYATVIANRLPIPGTNCVAHLISLESLGKQLPQDDGTYATPPTWKTIRLVSLKSWSFYVAPLKASFQHILQGLNGGITQNKTESGDSQLRLPAGYVPAAVQQLKPPASPFDSGYTAPAGSDGAKGETAWYRGPFVPSTITPPDAGAGWTPNPLPANAASDLNVQVSSKPKTDISLAAAWQLGRLLALADRDFAGAQVSWKRDIRLALNTKLGQTNQLTGGSRKDYAARLRKAIADPAQITSLLGAELSVTAASGKLTIPQALVDWLGRLALLYNVPINYLIADPHMLPGESLKFFNIDPRWTACLLDGAWSLERQPATQWAFDTAYQPWRQILEGSLRTSFIPDEGVWPRSGIILNSTIVSGYWPGFDFVATPEAKILREDRPGPDTLLVLFDQTFTNLEIRQPPEGIHFGFDVTGSGNPGKNLRYVKIQDKLYPTPSASPAPAPGTPAPAKDGLTTIPQRIPGVIQLAKLANAIGTQLGLKDLTTFSPAEFALELIEDVARVEFILPVGE